MAEGKAFRISENILSDDEKDSDLPVVVTRRELPNIVSESSSRNNLPDIEMELVPRPDKPKPTLPSTNWITACLRFLISIGLCICNVVLWPAGISFIKIRNDTEVDITCVLYPGRGLGNPVTLFTTESILVDWDDFVLKKGEEQIFSIGKDKKDRHVLMLGCVLLVLDKVRPFWPAVVAIKKENDTNLEFSSRGIPIHTRGPEFKADPDFKAEDGDVEHKLQWDESVYQSPLETAHRVRPDAFFKEEVPEILDDYVPGSNIATVAFWAFSLHHGIQNIFRCDPHFKSVSNPSNPNGDNPVFIPAGGWGSAAAAAVAVAAGASATDAAAAAVAVELKGVTIPAVKFSHRSTVKVSTSLMRLFSIALVRIKTDLEVYFADLGLTESAENKNPRGSVNIRKAMVAFAWKSKFDFMKYFARLLVNFYNEFVLLILESLDDGHDVYKIITLVLGVIAVVPCNADRSLPSDRPGPSWKGRGRSYADQILLYITPMAVGAVIQILVLGTEVDGLAKQIVFITSLSYLFAVSFAAICCFCCQGSSKLWFQCGRSWPIMLKLVLSVLMLGLSPAICAAAILTSTHDVFYVVGPACGATLVMVIYGVRFGLEPTHLAYAMGRSSVVTILGLLMYVLKTLFHFLYTTMTCQWEKTPCDRISNFFAEYLNNVLHLLVFLGAVGTGYWLLFLTDFYVTAGGD